MPIDKATALAHIDAVTARSKELGQNWVPENVQEITTLSCAAIRRLAPPGSAYLEQMESVLKNTQKSITRSRDEEVEFRLRGILSALRGDYENGRIMTPAKSDIPAFLQIEKSLMRFHVVAQQLRKRHDHRPSLWINDEYDVQDLLHALLRIDFDDIRPEEWTPSYAGGSARMDFLLKKEQVVIEAKKTRENLRDREVGEELIIDIAKYKGHPNSRTLICFVYDPDQHISNPVGLKRDLEALTTDELAVAVYVCQH
jgi:REase_DpnII-MboI